MTIRRIARIVAAFTFLAATACSSAGAQTAPPDTDAQPTVTERLDEIEGWQEAMEIQIYDAQLRLINQVLRFEAIADEVQATITLNTADILATADHLISVDAEAHDARVATTEHAADIRSLEAGIDALEAQIDTLDELLTGNAIAHANSPLQHDWHDGLREGESAVLTWVGKVVSAEPITITLPEIDGLTFDPQVLVIPPFARQNYPVQTTVTADRNDIDEPGRVHSIVPTITGWGVTLRSYGTIISIVD